jgi:hypothetical protein
MNINDNEFKKKEWGIFFLFIKKKKKRLFKYI